MEKFLKAAFGLLQVSRIDVEGRPLLDFSHGGLFRVRDGHKGVLLLGSPGSGKTTALRTLLVAMLRAGYGGVILIVKEDFVGDAMAAADAAGRSRDLIVLRPGGVARFNPFSACESALDAAALLVEVSDSQIEGRTNLGEGDWQKQRDALLQNLCIACEALHGEISFERLHALFRELPHSTSALSDAAFQKNALGGLYRRAREGALARTAAQAVISLCHDFAGMPEKTQGSVRAMVVPVFQVFNLPALSEIFTGEPTVTIDDTLNHRKVLMAAIPRSREEQRAANAVLQYCLCQAAQTRPRKTDAFLVADEFQETVGGVLVRSLSLLRQFRVTPVLATQSLPAIEYRTGATGRKTIVGLISTVFCFAQSDTETRVWAEEYVGNEMYTKKTYSTHDGKMTTTTSREERPKLHRDRLATLKPGKCFRLKPGDYRRASWPERAPRGPTPLRIK